MALKMNPVQCRDEASRIVNFANQFETMMCEHSRAIMGLPWLGDSQAAFQNMFNVANKHFDYVQGELNRIGTLLRRAADGIDETDKALARSFTD